MPYIKPAEQAALMENYLDAHEPGHLNFLITQMLIEGWKAAPKYSTIHKMYSDFVLEPEKNTALMKFYHALTNKAVTKRDIRAAAALAFFEFYRRVGSCYEDLKMLQNGDIYREIVPDLYKAVQAELEKRKPSGLLLPNMQNASLAKK